MLFAQDPDYMNMSPREAIKAWHNYQDSNVTETFKQYRKFIHAFAGKFPLDYIRKRAEEAAYNNTDSQEKTIEYFEFNPIITGKGLIAYVKALLALSKQDDVINIIRRYWLELEFSKQEIKELIQIAKPFLKKADFNKKLDALLSQGKLDLARDFMQYVDAPAKKIAQLRISIQKYDHTEERGTIIAKKNSTSEANQAAKKILAQHRNNSNALFDVIRYFRKSYKTHEAIKILESVSRKIESDTPENWWNERNILARRMMEEGNWKKAHSLISKHCLKKGESFVNAEWIVSWLELTKLNKKESAANRFIILHGTVGMPISKSRMAFWAAEALTAIKEKGRALEYYKKAAALPATFYGQIAISRLKNMGESTETIDLERTPHVSEQAKETFNNRFLIQCLKDYGENLPVDLQITLLTFIGAQLTEPGEEILITEFAHHLGGTYLSTAVAKKAQYLGMVLTKYGYPMLDAKLRTSIYTKLPPLIQSFAHSIIRQESNFNETAVSTAKAKGLMQLMDHTANAMKLLSPRYGLPSVSGDIHDRRVNVTLGTAHLLEHLEKYQGYLVLTLAAYNAGESNVKTWIKDFGDPRETNDWLNWIESIPFGETRNYVQRVLENASIYAVLFDPNQQYEVIDWITKPVPFVKRR